MSGVRFQTTVNVAGGADVSGADVGQAVGKENRELSREFFDSYANDKPRLLY